MIALGLILIGVGLRILVVPALISSPDTMHIVVTKVQPTSAQRTMIFDHQFPQQASEIYAQLTAGVSYDSIQQDRVLPILPDIVSRSQAGLESRRPSIKLLRDRSWMCLRIPLRGAHSQAATMTTGDSCQAHQPRHPFKPAARAVGCQPCIAQLLGYPT
jgi:hypothetical protein